ncbi:hypothetical protein OsI_25783 [Oryza sativa Indica Group]|uniref:Uncharacterized protein n=1 Tax=Oryza sativa subsp. indica TaxID=39946 RepID=A2YKN7_ORYSI|nr:hypothetical protein OsI_25783 [Oryza sativa Indica Group]
MAQGRNPSRPRRHPRPPSPPRRRRSSPPESCAASREGGGGAKRTGKALPRRGRTKRRATVVGSGGRRRQGRGGSGTPGSGSGEGTRRCAGGGRGWPREGRGGDGGDGAAHRLWLRCGGGDSSRRGGGGRRGEERMRRAQGAWRGGRRLWTPALVVAWPRRWRPALAEARLAAGQAAFPEVWPATAEAGPHARGSRRRRRAVQRDEEQWRTALVRLLWLEDGGDGDATRQPTRVA